MEKEKITQFIRVIDVLVLAPVMLKASTNKNLSSGLRMALAVGGITTGVYNAYNFFTHLK